MPGLVCGIIAALLILFEMLLWPRKVFRRLRLGQTKYWMAAHIWLGLACFPIAWIHSGYDWGGRLTTLLMGLLLVTVVSGIYGFVAQNILPGWMLRHLPAETIYSQIDYVASQTTEDLRRMLTASCGPPPKSDGSARMEAATAATWVAPELAEARKSVVIGAVREIGRVRGRTLRTSAVTTDRADSVILWNAFFELRPFLDAGRTAGGPAVDPARSARWFELLRRSCHDSSEEMIACLEQACDQRRQFDTQRRAHVWLHGWIPWHVAFSVALSVLLGVHVIAAIWYS